MAWRDSFTASAALRDAAGSPISGRLVEFHSTVGDSGYDVVAFGATDEFGQARIDLPMAAYYAQNADLKLKYAGKPTGKGYYAIALRKENEALAAEVDLKAHQLLGFFDRLGLDDCGDAKLDLREIVIRDRRRSGRRRRRR